MKANIKYLFNVILLHSFIVLSIGFSCSKKNKQDSTNAIQTSNILNASQHNEMLKQVNFDDLIDITSQEHQIDHDVKSIDNTIKNSQDPVIHHWIPTDSTLSNSSFGSQSETSKQDDTDKNNTTQMDQSTHMDSDIMEVEKVVNEFLVKNNIKSDFLITDDILYSALQKLDIDKNIFNTPVLKKYKNFLNKFGSIYSTAFDLYRYELLESENLDDINKKVDHIVSKQIIFQQSLGSLCERDTRYQEIKKEHCWLVAENKYKKYYVTVNPDTVGRFYLYHERDGYIERIGNLIDFLKDYKYSKNFLKNMKKKANIKR